MSTTCPICRRTFLTERRAVKHILAEHELTADPKSDVIIVSWKCESCNEIHEEEYAPENRGDALALASQIILNDEDFNVVEWRNGEMRDETNAVIMAIAIIGNLYDQRINLDGEL